MQILFIEDDPMNRRVVKDMLSVAGIAMHEAVDAESGLAMIEAQTFDIVLMDLRMPGMDGLTAVRHIRARADAKAEVPIIVITADTGPNLRRDCLAQGADDMLVKPIAMQDLFDSIGQMMTRQRGAMELTF